MSRRSLGVLVFVVAALGAWVVLSRRSDPRLPRDAQAAIGRPVLSELDLVAVEAIEIETPARTVRLALAEDGWVVESVHGYPADMTRLVRQVRRLGEVKAGAVIRGGEERLGEFGLDPGQGELRTPTIVRFFDGEGTQTAELMIGNERQVGDAQYGGRPDGTYVRAGEGPVLLVAESLTDFPRDADGWMSKQLTDIRERWIQSITVAYEGSSRTLIRDDDREWTVEGLDAAKEEMDSGKADGLARALEFLRFSEIPAQDLDDAVTGMDDPATAVFTFRNGVRLVVRIGSEAEGSTDRYLRVTASREAAQDPDAAEDEPAGTPEGPDLADVRRLERWLFRVSASTADRLRVNPTERVRPVVPDDPGDEPVVPEDEG